MLRDGDDPLPKLLRVAHKEIKEDQHPVIVISAIDIVDLLRRTGKGSAAEVTTWLSEQFPKKL